MQANPKLRDSWSLTIVHRGPHVSTFGWLHRAVSAPGPGIDRKLGRRAPASVRAHARCFRPTGLTLTRPQRPGVGGERAWGKIAGAFSATRESRP